LIEISHISDIRNEVFGPVLHLRKFKSSELNEVIEEINSTGFGLTFGIQTRIEERIHSVSSAVNVGNIYANRTTIGAQVGCQPFGGEGRSGTGFKAGGPYYLLRFCSERVLTINTAAIGGNLDLLNGSSYQ
jgi:RHH-type proline utilization regulon transcriptional repressor/proline dehydrogenase/delta 1-pyrroline-5-carboxylate dehydrogenase